MVDRKKRKKKVCTIFLVFVFVFVVDVVGRSFFLCLFHFCKGKTKTDGISLSVVSATHDRDPNSESLNHTTKRSLAINELNEINVGRFRYSGRYVDCIHNSIKQNKLPIFISLCFVCYVSGRKHFIDGSSVCECCSIQCNEMHKLHEYAAVNLTHLAMNVTLVERIRTQYSHKPNTNRVFNATIWFDVRLCFVYILVHSFVVVIFCCY